MFDVKLCSANENKSIKADIIELSENEFSLKVPAAAVGEGWESVEIFYDTFSATDEDNGYYIIPDRSGGRLVRFKKTESDGEYISEMLALRMVACTINGTAYVGKVVGMGDEYQLICNKENQRYHYFLRFPLEGRKPYEDIEIILYKTNDKDFDYNSMAHWYRDKSLDRGDITPLSEKIKTRPAVKYANESVNIRIRLAWKPAPATVLEQTRETEPPVHVACTFEMVEDLIDELKKQGVNKADICLVGWNISGHDGRWPEMFPIEPKLGGEEGLKRLIAKAEAAGYYLNLHSNFSDAYTIAENFSEDFIVKQKDGSLYKNQPWSGGTMYSVSLPYRKDAYIADLRKIAGLGIKGVHYCDVVGLLPPKRSYSSQFPMTPGDYRQAADEAFVAMQEIFGASSSEGGLDNFLKYLDYALYVEFPDAWENEEYNKWMDEIIPLWAMVYHGSVIFNVAPQSINFAVKDKKYRLKMLEQGARPAAYCFVDFYSIPIWGTEDLTWDKSEGPGKAAKVIAEMYNLYKEYQCVQYAFIEKHEKIKDGVFKTTYDNGVSITVDYNTNQYSICNKSDKH